MKLGVDHGIEIRTILYSVMCIFICSKKLRLFTFGPRTWNLLHHIFINFVEWKDVNYVFSQKPIQKFALLKTTIWLNQHLLFSDTIIQILLQIIATLNQFENKNTNSLWISDLTELINWFRLGANHLYHYFISRCELLSTLLGYYLELELILSKIWAIPNTGAFWI